MERRTFSRLLVGLYLRTVFAMSHHHPLPSKSPLEALSEFAADASAPTGAKGFETTDVELGPNQVIQGKVDPKTGQRHFLGIPFAAPPVGDLRWRAPQPEASWDGTKTAFAPGASCMQTPSAFTIGSQISEDCLFLNVFAPPAEDAPSAVAPKAVMVWFYGGSWELGSATCPLYYGENLVARSGGSVLVVTVNYRLNTFGFLGADALRDGDAAGSTVTGEDEVPNADAAVNSFVP